MPNSLTELLNSKVQTAPQVPGDEHIADPEAVMARKRELLKRVQTIREFNLTNRGAVLAGNQAKDYCWVNIREDRQVFFLGQGWELVTEVSAPEVKTHYRQPDGTHKRADAILYQIDKDLLEALQTSDQLRGLEGVQGARRSFENETDRYGVKTYTPTIR